jgi:hypothetical protein
MIRESTGSLLSSLVRSMHNNSANRRKGIAVILYRTKAPKTGVVSPVTVNVIKA